MFRPLNVKCERRFQSSPAEPKVEVVKLPGHTVLYDVNSMAAVEVDDKTALKMPPAGCERLHAERTQLRGEAAVPLLRSDGIPVPGAGGHARLQPRLRATVSCGITTPNRAG